MTAIDVPALISGMSKAAAKAVGEKWPSLRDYAETEFKKLAETAVHIEAQKASGKIDEDEAATLVDMQKNASRTVLLGAEGIGLLVAEAAINAALGVLKTAINAATGFALI